MKSINSKDKLVVTCLLNTESLWISDPHSAPEFPTQQGGSKFILFAVSPARSYE